MSKRSKQNRNTPPAPEPGLLVQIDGAAIDAMVIGGEQWLSPEEHLALLSKVDEQAAEIERLKMATPVDATNGKPEVKKHLRCPLCWERLCGYAARRKWQRQVNGPLQQRCYVCGECGTEWVVEVRAEEEDGILYTTTRVVEVREPASEAQVE